MVIDETDILDSEYYDEASAMACLLAEGYCFLYSFNEDGKEGTAIAVNINDVFAWGLAEAENICCTDGQEGSEVIELYKAVRAHERWGVVKWVCKKRNKQPQKAIIQDMKKNGAWEPWMDGLDENLY